MSLMRSSSVWLVLSTLAYQLSLAGLTGVTDWAGAFITDFLVKISGIQNGGTDHIRQKKTAGYPAVFERLFAFFLRLREDLSTAKGA